MYKDSVFVAESESSEDEEELSDSSEDDSAFAEPSGPLVSFFSSGSSPSSLSLSSERPAAAPWLRRHQGAVVGWLSVCSLRLVGHRQVKAWRKKHPWVEHTREEKGVEGQWVAWSKALVWLELAAVEVVAFELWPSVLSALPSGLKVSADPLGVADSPPLFFFPSSSLIKATPATSCFPRIPLIPRRFGSPVIPDSIIGNMVAMLVGREAVPWAGGELERLEALEVVLKSLKTRQVQPG